MNLKMLFSRVILNCVLIVSFILILSPGNAQQEFKSKQLDSLLQRHGWIKIGLDESASSAQIQMQRGGSIIADGR